MAAEWFCRACAGSRRSGRPHPGLHPQADYTCTKNSSNRMILSRGCEYGLRAMLYLVSLDEKGFVPIRRLSDELDIEFHFLTKLFQQLSDAGIIHSQRGPRGGISLARPASRISMLDVVLAIDGDEIFTECVMGLPGCGEQKPCPMHRSWAVERERLKAMFSDTALDNMAARARREGNRLKFITPEAVG